ncbi:MAG: 50S ribosomal protein L10 [bacterium]|nr:50S ribosomal protein L10 [bacterium]MDZ4284828.1 50S ribosomal protein L10 [Patescibacteria group bacterium]
MVLTREKKQRIVSELDGILTSATALVFVRFHGLSLADTTSMRRTLREKGVGFHVAKKTLMHRALRGREVHGVSPELPGEVAIAYAEDALASAREVHAFSRKFKDALTILGGVFEGRYIDRAAALELATIPSRETLIAQVVQLINSPLSRLAVVVDQIAKSRE